MTKVSRSDIYIRDEKGPEWLEDFFRHLAGHKDAGVQEILDAINNKRNQTVDSLVKSYREQTGLDILGTSEDDENIKEASVKNASGIGPISPMKLKKLDSPDDILKDYDDSEIIVQIKFDGFKTQAIKDKDSVRLYTRRGEEFTENVPSLVKELNAKMKPGSFILGELVWEDSKGNQSISDIQTVVGSSPDKAHEKIESGNGNVVFCVYDFLWENGNDITKQKYSERYDKVKKTIGKGAKHLKVADNYSYSEKDKAINDALKVNAEGIVLKPKDSEYKYGVKGSNEPHGEWAKFKPEAKAHKDEVILNEYEKAENKFIFPMYQYKDGELFEVGKLSGMSKEDEAKIKKDIDSGKAVVVEITYQERMSSGKFRHVGWSRFRPDKPAKEVKVAKSSFRPLSVRHAEERKSIVDIIESNPKLKSDIENLCHGSGGTKPTLTIINFVRDQLDGELVSFTDEELIKYINDIKNRHQQNMTDQKTVDVGKVGTTPEENYEDNVADYVTHGAK